MKLIVFYSWQSTTDSKFNKNFIFSCIKKALKKLERSPEFSGVEFIVQEGVRDTAGSPGVAKVILEDRIPHADIFIADLSVVNQIPNWLKWVQKKLGYKFKPTQNNNVINEHGVASNALGPERIIGVLNTEYGSPNENPDNIPFDLRHLRFPITFSYSKKCKNIESVKEQFISELSNALKNTAKYAIQFRKNKFNPLMVWKEWENSISSHKVFHTNEKIRDLINQIKEATKNPTQTTRLLGLSGLGKSRILLETFRPDSTNQSIIQTGRILYINCNLHPNADYQSLFTQIADTDEKFIVILDNCPSSLHRQTIGYSNRNGNQISFISIDSNPEEIHQDKIDSVNYLLIKKDELFDVVEKILDNDFPGLTTDQKQKIIQFSQGIPFMAVLLAESAKDGENFIGKLNDKDLFNKLLGDKGQNEENRTCLMSCAIFNYFGFYDDISSQLEFIATNKNVTPLSGDSSALINKFKSICDYFLKREIFERKGRFIGMRPFPLALYLAQEWLNTCSSKRLLSLIDDIANLTEPDRRNLSEGLAEQMKNMGYDTNAIFIVENIVGHRSPFDTAEVLNTELGSRLFRSFVEVNPVAVSQNFVRNFSNKTNQELLEFRVGRRNIVWVLEKLCFDHRTFYDSAKILFAFAVAENEKWANNATGQLLQLFNIHLAGTEASLEQRLNIIKWALIQKHPRYNELAIKAMDIALNYGSFTRMSGAENQGTKILKDFYPTYEQVGDYWKTVLNLLFDIATTNPEYSELIFNIISNKTRGIIHAGYIEIILPVLTTIAARKEYNWDEALDTLKMTVKYEGHLLSDVNKNQINRLITLLTKTDFVTKYHRIVNGFYRFEIDEDDTEEKVIHALKVLAREFCSEHMHTKYYYKVVYTSPQFHAEHFGKEVYEIIKNDSAKIDLFIKNSFAGLSEVESSNRNVLVLGTFLQNASQELKDEIYLRLYNDKTLSPLLFSLVTYDFLGYKNFDLLFQLVENKKSPISALENLAYGNAINNLNPIELNNFINRLFSFGEDGYEVAFSILSDINYKDSNKRKQISPLLKECIYKLGLKKELRNYIDRFKWRESILFLLNKSNEHDFARFINTQIIQSISYSNSYHLDNDIQKIYEVLLTKYFDVVWPDISAGLLSEDEDYHVFYGLKNILGSHIGGVSRREGVLFTVSEEAIFNWMRINQPLAPIRIAELIPIFDKGNTDYNNWNPMVLKMLEEFGNNIEVLRTLKANMGTYSWTGSLIPYLEAKLKLFQQLKNHSEPLVVEWSNSNIKNLTKEIEMEKIRDEERYI